MMDDVSNARRWLQRFPLEIAANVTPGSLNMSKGRWLRWDGQRFAPMQEGGK